MRAAIQQAQQIDQGWLVANTQPHKEQFALENLARQNFDSYCPMVQKTIRHARRMQHVLRPLFPGYVFVANNPENRGWRSIQSTFGIRRIVSNGDNPSYLGEDFVLALRAREIDGAIVLPAEPYRVGQDVRMIGGAFDGVVATILELDEKGRITVLMDILNQSVKVSTTYHGLRAV